MQKTKIPWCDYSWNPVVGCSLPLVSISCEHCYARKLHNMRHQARKAGKTGLPKQYAKPFEEIQLFPDRLEDPLKLKKPATIFVGSMTDLFGEDVPDWFIYKVLDAMYRCPQHKFMVLTKRIKRFAETTSNPIQPSEKKPFPGWDAVPWPLPNVRLGVSICNQEDADEKIPILLSIPVAHRFISAEPQLGPIDAAWCFDPIQCPECGHIDDRDGFDVCGADEGKLFCNRCTAEVRPGILEGVKQCIIGCESGPKRRPCKREWIKSLYDQCKAAGVEVMVKQMEINGKVCKDPARCERRLNHGN